jgi:heme exporter protein C
MARRKINWYKYTSPANFYPLAGKLIPFFVVLTAVLLIAGLYVGFFVAPKDAVQGEAYRIIYIHVPAAWMAMFLYLLMAVYAALGLAFNARIWAMMAAAIAPTGAMFAFISLWTGALWDARLTSTLILFFLYLGFISLQSAIEDTRRADRAGALLAIVGAINVPIIYFSVQWWNTLHQGASLRFGQKPSMAPVMLAALLIMIAACWMYAIAVTLMRVRNIILERESHAPWVAELAGGRNE